MNVQETDEGSMLAGLHIPVDSAVGAETLAVLAAEIALG